MSIYASAWGVDTEDHADPCPRWVTCPRKEAPEDRTVAYFDGGRVAWLDDSQPCTCGAGPIVYQASHILPSDADTRRGSVDVAEIPGWIERADRPAVDPEETFERIWPWLRLWVHSEGPTDLAPGHAVVLLDRSQIEGLHAYLGRWLERAVPALPSKGEAVAEHHILVVHPEPPDDRPHLRYTVECPGVSDDCRGWSECHDRGCPPFAVGSAAEGEAEADGGYEAHGVWHRWDGDGPGWLPQDECWLVGAEELHDAADELLDAPIPGRGAPPAAGRHPIQWQTDWRGEQLTLHLTAEVHSG